MWMLQDRVMLLWNVLSWLQKIIVSSIPENERKDFPITMSAAFSKLRLSALLVSACSREVYRFFGRNRSNDTVPSASRVISPSIFNSCSVSTFNLGLVWRWYNVSSLGVLPPAVSEESEACSTP